MLLLIFQKLDGMSSEGLIRSPELPSPIPFRGCADLFLKMDRIYNLLNQPQAARQMRRLARYRDQILREPEREAAAWSQGDSWRVRDAWRDPEPSRGKAALCVCTQYRQHNSWQGYIYREDQEKVFFRSALELLYLLDDYLREQKERIGGKVSKMGRMGE